MKTKLFYAISLILVAFSACKKDEPLPPVVPEDPQGTVEIRFVPTINGNALSLNEINLGPNNQRMLVETFKFYMSSIKVFSDNQTLGESDVALIDFSKADKSFSFKANPGNITSLSFDIGLNSLQNGTTNPDFNPAAFDNSHPLSVYNSMYWTWASGYIFLKIEGRTDTSLAQNATPMFTWFYHSGMDSLTRNYTLSDMNIEVEAGKTSIIELGIEFNDIFMRNGTPINMIDEYFTHTTDNYELAEDVIVNFGSSIRKL